MKVTWGPEFGALKPIKPMRGRINRLQEEMSHLPQLELKTVNTFHGGMLCREVFRPKGAIIVGKVHKKEHFYYVVFGTVRVVTDESDNTLIGPCLVKSTPGTKRAVTALTDALCMTIHRTDTDNVEHAEMELVEPDSTALFDALNQIKQGVLK